MAFLDNSGDIILDAVLTDTGRLRLARGDGSFKITKFAFGDDEVNYGLYDKNNASGSAYYDLDILQMPVFEAFTNNTSVLKYPLLSISRTNLLYLPILKLSNKKTVNNAANFMAAIAINGNFVVKCDDSNVTQSYDVAVGNSSTTQTLNGVLPSQNANNGIKIDQGIDSNVGLTPNDTGNDLKSSGLYESQYMIMLDNRLATLVAASDGATILPPSFIDDDNIATYFISEASNAGQFISHIRTNSSGDNTDQVILGPTGTTLSFLLKITNALKTGTELFTKLGGEDSSPPSGEANTFYYIDTNVVVKGVTTGASLTIPVRFVKYKP